MLVVLVVAACGDDTVTQDTSTPSDTTASDSLDDAAPDVADDAVPDTEPSTCEAELTEVDAGFVEVVTRGPCAGFTVEVRDASVFECTLTATGPLSAGRSTLDVTMPAAAIIVVREGNGVARWTWTLGDCEPDLGCLTVATDPLACLPNDNDAGSVSLCGARWLAGRTPTPGTANDCDCRIDCTKAAGSCQNGACVDGSCVFADKADGTGCEDQTLCTTGDQCVAGACVGTSVACGAPPGPCASAGVCVAQTGLCIFPDTCGDNATCGATGCECLPGFEGDGTTCTDIDECDDDPCAGGECINFPGTYQCECPPGTSGPDCVATTCDCDWEAAASCGVEVASLSVRVVDLWAQPLAAGNVLVEDASKKLMGYGLAGEVDLPLCNAFFADVRASAPVHHAAVVGLRWTGSTLEATSTPSSDAAWSLTFDDATDTWTLWVGLAHRWFAAAGRPARLGNRVEFLMNGEDAWKRVHTAVTQATSLITGTSWWWTSELELVRDRANDKFLTPGQRWLNTVMGTLEQRVGIERKILVNQFLSQDGLFSGLTVDDDLTEKGETSTDKFDYLGQANEAAGAFTVTLPTVDFAARVAAKEPAAGEADDDEEALAFMPPIGVDITEVPLGLSAFDLPIASWHQKFWTIDQKVAFIGGMNAKTSDWDTNEYRVFEPLRMEFDADRDDREAVERKEEESDIAPRKDYMVRIDGPGVADAVDVFHRRWEQVRADGVEYAENASGFTPAAPPAAHADGVQAQVIATMPAPFSEYAILESLLRAVSQAQDFIYIEDQYFRAPILYDAIVQRMAAIPSLKLIVVTNPVSEWVDPGCWQTAIAYDRFKRLYPSRFRIYWTQTYDVVRTDCTFCWDETEAHFVPINLHSKLVIIDDEYVEIGSANSNNRGLLYEGELALAVHDAAFAAEARRRVFANLLGGGAAGDMVPSDMFGALDAAAAKNQTAYDKWDDEGMDLDLDGDPIPGGMTPTGILYPLVFDTPDECLFEDIGADVT